MESAPRSPVQAKDAGNLCLSCGLCCNGVLFGDVQLQPEDSAARLRSLGITLVKRRFQQPCSAWRECRCWIYEDRPAHCRQFVCGLLARVQHGAIQYSQALRVIAQTHKQVDAVRALLRALGDQDEQVDLRRRFLQLTERLGARALSRRDTSRYSKLTLTFHKLDRVLRGSFFDG